MKCNVLVLSVISEYLYGQTTLVYTKVLAMLVGNQKKKWYGMLRGYQLIQIGWNTSAFAS